MINIHNQREENVAKKLDDDSTWSLFFSGHRVDRFASTSSRWTARRKDHFSRQTHVGLVTQVLSLNEVSDHGGLLR